MVGLLEGIGSLVSNPVGAISDAIRPPGQGTTMTRRTLSRPELLAEAYKRGLLSPEQHATYEQAVKRGIVHDPYASARMDAVARFGPANPTQGDAAVQSAANGFTWGAMPTIMGAGAAMHQLSPQQILLNLAAGKGPVSSPGAAFSATRDTANDRLAAGNQAYPLTSLGATLGAGAFAPGSAAVGKVVNTVAAPVMRPIANVVNNAVVQPALRLANRATNGGVLDTGRVAGQRLAYALRQDGATPDQLQQIMNEWLRVGGTSPTLMDLAAKLPSGGETTLGLLRGAAMKGGAARGAATRYADQVGADLQDNAIARTRQLTPDNPQPASAMQQTATAARKAAAQREYQAPYATQVDAAPVMPALQGTTGARAIAAANSDADALRMAQQQAELSRLQQATTAPAQPAPQPAGGFSEGSSAADQAGLQAKIAAAMGGNPASQSVPVSLGTLDRIKIALREAGDKAARSGDNASATGFGQRAAEIDAHLAQASPAYAGARDNYATASARLDALAHGGDILSASPDEFAQRMAELTQRGRPDVNLPNIPAPQPMAQVGARQAITDAIGRPTEGATGTLNRVSTATNPGRNLGVTFGEEPAADYRQSLQNMTDQLRVARTMDPGTGSPTAQRLIDLGLSEDRNLLPSHFNPINPLTYLPGLIRKIRQGVTLTDAEREAVVRIGQSGFRPGELNLQPPSVQAPRLPVSPFAAPAVAYGNNQR